MFFKVEKKRQTIRPPPHTMRTPKNTLLKKPAAALLSGFKFITAGPPVVLQCKERRPTFQRFQAAAYNPKKPNVCRQWGSPPAAYLIPS